MPVPDHDSPHLTLRIDPESDLHYPSLLILIDGEDVLGEGDDLQGFPLESMLGPGNPLVPVPGGRRVGVFRCGCGAGGCAVSAPWIEQVGDEVVWSDFRSYVGVFDEPTVPVDTDLSRGRLRRPDTFRFRAQDYLDEVARAGTMSWRTPQRFTADLVNAAMRSAPRWSAGSSSTTGISPSHVDDSFHLWMSHTGPRGPDPRRLEPPRGSPQAQADWILNYLETTPESQWPRLYADGTDDDTAG